MTIQESDLLLNDCASCYSDFQDGNLLTGVCVQPTIGANAYLFMLLVEAIIKTQCTISDPCRRVKTPKKETYYEMSNEMFDFIIVGAGSAGVVVANRLTEDPTNKVLLLEAGIEEPTSASVPIFTFNASTSVYDWKYETVPQERACKSTGGVCEWPRGKMICGTACLSGHMYSRGSAKVYNEWGAANPGWKYDEILRYFRKSESNNEDGEYIEKEYHGYDGPLTVSSLPFVPDIATDILAAGEEMGYPVDTDINGKSPEAFTIAPIMSEDGVMVSPAKAFLRPALGRPNLKVLIEAYATKIIFDKSGTKALAIEYHDKFGITHTVNASKEIILSGGVIGSPQLLMVSGVGPKAHLEEKGIKVVKDLPVGGNLHYHVGLSIGVRVAGKNNNTITAGALFEYIKSRKGPFASNGLTQVTTFFASTYGEKGVPDTQVFFDGYLGRCRTHAKLREHSKITFRPIYLLTKCRGTIKLKSSNPYDKPLIDPNYLCDPKEEEVLLESVEMLRNLTKTKALGSKIVRWDIEENKLCKHLKKEHNETAYWRCVLHNYTNGENHHSGTCKMGPASDSAAVVDHQLKVHGISNLRVADGSIFPSPPNCNPIAPTIMVGEKVSDLIKEQWKEYVDPNYF